MNGKPTVGSLVRCLADNDDVRNKTGIIVDVINPTPSNPTLWLEIKLFNGLTINLPERLVETISLARENVE